MASKWSVSAGSLCWRRGRLGGYFTLLTSQSLPAGISATSASAAHSVWLAGKPFSFGLVSRSGLNWGRFSCIHHELFLVSRSIAYTYQSAVHGVHSDIRINSRRRGGWECGSSWASDCIIIHCYCLISILT